MPLPNLIVIGAHKCGTSSLQHYLNLHPEISMAQPGHEPDFFSQEPMWRRGLPWYEGLFQDAPVRGEKSNTYSGWPFWPFVPERMKDVVPGVRLVYIVRDPIDRIVAAWLFHARHGTEYRAFEDALASLDDSLYVVRSRYATQLERYLAHFPQEQIHVVDGDELRHARDGTLATLFRFIGVDDTFTSPLFDRRLQVADEGRWLSPRGRSLVNGLDRMLGPESTRRLAGLVPKQLRLLAREPAPRPAVEGELRERLAAILGPEVERLRGLTGQRFESWSL